jgi:hypothetical protein
MTFTEVSSTFRISDLFDTLCAPEAQSTKRLRTLRLRQRTKFGKIAGTVSKNKE